MSDILQTVDWSRAQFALTAIYHWLFVPLTLGLGVIIAIMESIYYRTGDDFWKRTTRFWMRLFGVNFAIGVATGLILEFEFGTNWSNYSHFVGDIFGAPLAIEGIMAFFLESTFIAVMSVRNEMTSFWEVAFSPVAVNKFSHTVTSSFTLAALFVVGVSAWYLLKRRERQMATRSIAVASLFGLVASLVTAYSGDRSGAIVARLQPMKLAAMEALYDGCEGAPLTAVGILRPESQRTSDDDAFYFKVDIPKMLSIMSFRDAEAYVAGINDLLRGNPEQGILPAEEKIARGRVAIDELARFRDARQSGDQETVDQITRKFDPSTPEGREFLGEYFAYFGYGYLQSPEQLVPNIPLLFYSFRVMVGAGCLFILMLALVWWYNRRDKLAEKRWLLRLAILCIPLAYLASQAGWVVAEVGRQPWVIQDLMPVGVGVSKLPGESVATTFFIFLALFTALLIAELSILFRQIKAGPGKE